MAKHTHIYFCHYLRFPLTTFFFFEKKNKKIKLRICLCEYYKYCFLKSDFYLKIYNFFFILAHQNDKKN